MLTVTSDGHPVNSSLLCQLMCLLCSCPGVNVFKRQPSPQRRSQSVLGALQIMVGVFNIGLGLLIFGSYIWGFKKPVGFGLFFIIAGIASILSERFSCSCMVVLSVILNLCGFAVALTNIVRYSIIIYRYNRSYSCEKDSDYWYRRYTTSPSPDWDAIQQKCLEANALEHMLEMSILISLVTLSCLELCVVISSATLNIIALKKRGSKSNDPEPKKITSNTTL